MTNIPFNNSTNYSSRAQIDALSDAISAVTEERSLDRALRRLAEIAAHLVNARYAALGVPDDKGGLANFFTYGMTEKQISHMDHLPRGLGLLGVLLVRPETIRLEQMSQDERSAGFCEHHPKMTSFLGVPIISKGKHLGNLYLSDRLDDQPFTEEDERMIKLLSGHAAIAIENAMLSDQLRRLAIVEERDRIAMDLHDGIIQSIYAIGIKLEISRSKLVNNPELDAQIVSTTQDLNRVIEDLRRYIDDLNVGVNYTVSLQEQIQEIAGGFSEVWRGRLIMDVARGFTHLTEARVHTIIQVLREALSNIVRHANATEVYVDLHETLSRLTLTISDNGQGFDADQVSKGHGLQNMRRRIKQLDGTIELTSRHNRGTTLVLTFPI